MKKCSAVTVRVFVAVLCLVLAAGFSPAAAGTKIVAVQSSRVKPYEDALAGFTGICRAKIKRLVLSEMNGSDTPAKIRSIKPDMILAIGVDALRRVQSITDIPVVYLLVPNPGAYTFPGDNVTGVSMYIPPERQLMALLEAVPGLKTIGLVYDPSRTGDFVAQAQKFASMNGLRLVTQKVHSSKQVPAALMDVAETAEALWMLPDLTVVTPETVEFLFLYALKSRLPVLTFSKKYVDMGALLSIGIDAVDMGRQAAGIANEILAGSNTRRLPYIYARAGRLAINPATADRIVVSINHKVAQKLGISVNDPRRESTHLTN